jgi:hypothetical protein
VTFLKQLAGQPPWKQPTKTAGIRLSDFESNELEIGSRKNFFRE